jgi:hypothetical protein
VSIDIHDDADARTAEVLTHETGVGAGGDEHQGACVSNARRGV